jgi:hypothetical protein
VDEHTLAYGPDRLLGLLGGERSPLDDAAFVELRDEAMPARAPGASLRLTARLSTDARIAAAGRMGLDEVPATISLWLDVADDLALVATLDAGEAAMAARFAQAIEALRDRGLPLAPGVPIPWKGLRVELDDTVARAVWVVGPKALAAWVAALGEGLAP